MEEILKKAKEASKEVAILSPSKKNAILLQMADKLEKYSKNIIEAALKVEMGVF